MSARIAIALVALAFISTVLIRLPARVLTPWLPRGAQCETPSGTVWEGGCTALQIGTASLDNLQWSLHPAALLHGRLAADVTSSDPAATGHTYLELSRDGALTVRGLAATVTLPDKFGWLPRTLAGTLQLTVSQAHAQSLHLDTLIGAVQLLELQLAQSADDTLALGSFAAQFAPQSAGAPIVGQLRDLGGPLSLTAELQLQADGAYALSGSVATRADAQPAIEQLLTLLGPADADGRHTLSLSGTY